MSASQLQQIAHPMAVLVDTASGSVGAGFPSSLHNYPLHRGLFNYPNGGAGSVEPKREPVTQDQLRAVLDQIDLLWRKLEERNRQRSLNALATPVLDAYMNGFRAAFGADVDLSIRPVEHTESLYELIVKLPGSAPDDAEDILGLEEQAVDSIRAGYPEAAGQLAVRYIYSE